MKGEADAQAGSHYEKLLKGRHDELERDGAGEEVERWVLRVRREDGVDEPDKNKWYGHRNSDDQTLLPLLCAPDVDANQHVEQAEADVRGDED